MEWMIEPLLKWYSENKRMLPWREAPTAYHVWVSEIMLQQTKVKSVEDYYEKFIEKLPTVRSLARISEERLLKIWEGLGYYNRVKNMKRAARIMVNEFNGEMPKDYETLLTLPGIGEYTAGAIASIVYNEKVPAVDGNVLRVISRIRADERDVLSPITRKDITRDLREIMPEQAGDFNEALMELGETICLASAKPICFKCPLAPGCKARALKKQAEIPNRERKTERTKEYMNVYLLKKDGKLAIRKREKTGLLSSMYEFPNSLLEIGEQLEKWNITAENIEDKGVFQHVFTHKEWYMQVFEVEVKEEVKPFIWAKEEELQNKYPMPTAFFKIIQAQQIWRELELKIAKREKKKKGYMQK